MLKGAYEPKLNTHCTAHNFSAATIALSSLQHILENNCNQMYFYTSATTLLAVIINLSFSSTSGINVNANQLLRRRSNDSDAHEVKRELYGWGQGITTDVQTDCKEIFAGWNEVCILVCTKVTSIMNGDELVDEYSSVSQQKCEENDNEDGWQSSGLVDLDSGNSDYSKSSKSKSVGSSGSGSSSGSKSSKSKSGGSGSSYTGSKSSKSGDYPKSSKGSGSYSKSSKGSDSYSKSAKSGGGGGSASGDIASDWGTTTVRVSPNDWSASWSNGYHHYSNPNIKQGGYSKSSKGSGSYSKSSKSGGAGSGSVDFSKSSKGSSSYSKGSKGSVDTDYTKSSKSGGGRSGSDTWSAPINLVSSGSDSNVGGW